jgi:Uncharacterised protein family UPF0547
VLRAILTIGGVIGAISGAATIVGWVASQDLQATATVTLTAAGIAFLVALLLVPPVYVAVHYLAKFAGWTRRPLSELWDHLVPLSVACWGICAFWFATTSADDRISSVRLAGAMTVVAAPVAGILRIVTSARRRRLAERASRKRCPDCAEQVKAEAHVCRHCGYRFGAGDDDELHWL